MPQKKIKNTMIIMECDVLDLKSQRRLAASILNIGINRIWIDPERTEDVELAITREEIRKLIREGAIKPQIKNSQSRARARFQDSKKKKGRRRGPGTKKGSKFSKVSRKTRWIHKIRAIRRRLKTLRDRRLVTVSTYRNLYRKAKGGEFESIAELERYISEQGLRRRAFV